MRFETDGRTVHARFLPQPDHIGFRGVVHGGILSTVLDEIMVWACAVRTRRFAYCAELNVRFINAVAPGIEIRVTGELVANRKNRLFEARGSLVDGAGKVLADAAGKYLPLKPDESSGMLGDLIGDTAWLADGRAVMEH